MSTKNILVPLDGTPQSNAALPVARAFATAMDASVTVLRVVDVDDSTAAAHARSTLRKIAEELAASGIRVDCVVREGDVVDDLLEQLQARPVDLVVMRTHGRAGLQRAVLGSVTERVLQRSRVPMVLMRPGRRRITGIHKLVVPVDGSPGGAVALGTAVSLARVTGASVKLVQVAVPIAMSNLVAYDYSGMTYYDPAWDDEALSAAKTYVDALVLRLRENGLAAEGDAIMAPSVPETIVEVAEKERADLIVMSTQALTGPARALLGSVADAVVRTAECPVLVVHRTGVAVESEAEASPVLVKSAGGA